MVALGSEYEGGPIVRVAAIETSLVWWAVGSLDRWCVRFLHCVFALINIRESMHVAICVLF